MACEHLRELYHLCEKNQIKLSGSDLIRIVCRQCQQEETCPSVMLETYETEQSDTPLPADENKTSDETHGTS